jgi:hypothetical protein
VNGLARLSGVFAVLALALAAGRAEAEDGPRPTEDGPRPPTSTGRIARIEVRTDNVFDLSQADNPLYEFVFKTGNFIHFTTRPYVVRRLLLFDEGDALDPELLAETERNLRAADQFEAASVTSERRPDGDYDVLVQTRDKWSLTAGAGVGYVGGVSKGNAQVSESNLLGLGKEVEVDFAAQTGQETGHASYLDPDIMGTRLQLALDGSLSSLGTLVSGSFGRPFYARLTPYAFSVGASRERADVQYFERGDVAATVREAVDRVEGSAGLGFGPYDSVKRISIAAAAESASFGAPTGADPLGFRWPRSRTIVDVALRPSINQFDVFEKWQRLDADRIVEDVPTGWRADATLGEQTRSDVLGMRPEALLGAHATWVARPLENDIFVFEAAWFMRHDGVRPQRQQVSSFLHNYLQLPWNTLATTVSFVGLLENEDLEPQLTLGEDSGLRGYPARFFTGTRRLLAHVEDRIFTPVNLLTFYLGFVAFADAGLVWDDAHGPRVADVRPSVGFGVRVFSAELLKTSVGRLDVAFPLDRRGGGIRGVSVSISTGQVFTLFGEEAELAPPF